MYYAQWTATTAHTVTFNGNGWTPTSSTRSVNINTAIWTLPADPTQPWFTFNGWFTATTWWTQITTATVITASVMYYAQWTAIASCSDGIKNNTEIWTDCWGSCPACLSCNHPHQWFIWDTNLPDGDPIPAGDQIDAYTINACYHTWTTMGDGIAHNTIVSVLSYLTTNTRAGAWQAICDNGNWIAYGTLTCSAPINYCILPATLDCSL